MMNAKLLLLLVAMLFGLLSAEAKCKKCDCNFCKQQCNNNECSGGCRRLLEENADGIDSLLELEKATGHCLDTHYEVSLHMHQSKIAHPVLVAHPTTDQVFSGCPVVAFHVGLVSEETMANKALVVNEANFNEIEDQMLPLASKVPLSDILQAYDESPELRSSDYDIVTHNCASLALDMAKSLDILHDTFKNNRIIDFVVDGLMDAGSEELIRRIDESPNSDSVIHSGWNRLLGSVGLDPRSTVRKLVKTYIERHIGDV